MYSFLYPWLFLLLPLPWVLRGVLPPRKVVTSAVRVSFGERIQAAMEGESVVHTTTRKGGAHLIPVLVWILLLTALARPQRLEPPLTRDVPTRDLLLLVDLSGSMQQQDFVNEEGESVDRLTAVKEVLGDFLIERKGDRVGLVVFGDSPYLQAPFSSDLNLAQQLLNETAIGMAGPRTAFGDAIGLGVSLFDGSEMPARTIIALTDGNDTHSQVPPVEAARVAQERGIRIHTVAIGDPTTLGEEKLDEETLRAVAQTAGGSYFFAADREQLAGIYDELDQIEVREVNVVSHRPRHDLFQWPLGLALLLSLLAKVWVVWRKTQASVSIQAPHRVHVDPVTGRLEVRP